MDRLGEKVQCNPTVKLEKGVSYPVIDMEKIKVGVKNVYDFEYSEYSGQSCSKFQSGDTIMARITPCLENGKIAQYNGESEKAFGSTELFVFRGISNVSDNDYVYYLLSTDFMRNNAANSMTGASGRQRADIKFIAHTKWDFPNYDTQKAIGSTLSAYDELIEKNNRKIAILQEQAQEIYKEWFVRFRFPGHETAKFENGLPVGWQYDKLQKVIVVFYGKDHSKLDDGDIPIYGSGGVMRYGNKALYDGESVLIPRKGSLNNIMWVNGAFWTVDTMFYTKALIPYAEKYIYYVLSALDMESYNAGAALPSMTTNILYHLKIMRPQESLLKKFDGIVSKMFAECRLLKLQNERMEQQRDLLLPRLMSGKLEVQQS